MSGCTICGGELTLLGVICGGELTLLGVQGPMLHYRCRCCGADSIGFQLRGDEDEPEE
jgi:hypothetical protein